MGGVEGDLVAEGEAGGKGADSMAGEALADAAVGVDGGGDAGVGVAQEPAAVFDGAQRAAVLPAVCW
jgi:hypothetical protein